MRGFMNNIKFEVDSLLSFVRNGHLGFIGIGDSKEKLLKLTGYKDEHDDGKNYPTIQGDEYLDWHVRFVFKAEIINIITIRFTPEASEPSKVYVIGWYDYVKRMHINEFERILKCSRIPYWKAARRIEGEDDEISIQTKGVPSVSIHFTKSELTYHISYFSDGLCHNDNDYVRFLEIKDL